MTSYEALKQIKHNDCAEFCSNGKENCSACRWGVAMDALKKQIPVKGPRLDHWTGICPSCKMPVSSTGKFCNECGQAIDWEVE